MNTGRMPLAFIGHGSPMNALEDNAWTRAWAALAAKLPRPEAILCLSAHFTTGGLYAVSAAAPETIHDFYGFPQALFDVQYPAPGSPALAGRAVSLLNGKAAATTGWGLDHGAWSVLKVMYPQADIPVVQLSLDLSLPPQEQLAIGKALSPLRDEGIFILGSGNVVHNLREIRMNQPEALHWAKAFGEAIHRAMLEKRWLELADYKSFEGSEKSVNSSEHFMPLLHIAGAASPGDSVRAINHDYVWGSLSMTGYVLGEQTEERE